MNDRAKIGVLILNYNDADTTINLYNSIIDFNVFDHLLIVDNASTDDSFDKLAKLHNKKLTVLKTTNNGGYAMGNNFGASYLIKQCGCDIIFIANPDVKFDEVTVKRISKIISSNKAKAATGIMINRDSSIGTKEIKIHSYYQDLLDCTLLLKRANLKKNSIDYNSSKLIETQFLYGSFFAVDSKSFLDVGGFDEKTFLYCEERILGKKYELKRYKMVIDPTVSYYHYHSVSINKSMNTIKKTEQLFKSRLYYWKEYGGISHIKLFLLKIMMSYGIAIRKITFFIIERKKRRNKC